MNAWGRVISVELLLDTLQPFGKLDLVLDNTLECLSFHVMWLGGVIGHLDDLLADEPD